MIFADRADAGRALAERLDRYKEKGSVILAIPRGGVVVGVEMARRLNIPLDVVLPRKIGAPGNPEMAIGAVAGRGLVMLNENLRRQLDVPDEYIEREVEMQLREIDRRRAMYLGDGSRVDLEAKTVIITDDGLATGYTALAAIQAVRQESPKELVLAIPVAPKDTYDRLSKEVTEIICLHTPDFFYAVGQFYINFSQVTDEEVVEVLKHFNEQMKE